MTILPIKLTNDDAVILLSRIAVIDLEASGLGSASYPTEIGWALLHDDGSITTSGACLIRPAAKWTIYTSAWSAASERLTGISQEMLDRDGLPPREAAARFLEAVGDRDLYSDEVDFDRHWLAMLFDAAGVALGERNIGDVKRLTGDWTVGADEPPRHRAEADARRLALTLSRSIDNLPQLVNAVRGEMSLICATSERSHSRN
jgi:DNA polymerase III epsilon subunit-like protein